MMTIKSRLTFAGAVALVVIPRHLPHGGMGYTSVAAVSVLALMLAYYAGKADGRHEIRDSRNP